MNLTKSLEQLENDYWKATQFPGGLVQKCYAYRKVPVFQLTINQLQTLISQQMGLEFLIPVAFEFLEKDILAEGDFYPGDLLSALLTLNSSVWQQFPRQRIKLNELLKSGKPHIENLNEHNEFRSLLREIETFLQSV